MANGKGKKCIINFQDSSLFQQTLCWLAMISIFLDSLVSLYSLLYPTLLFVLLVGLLQSVKPFLQAEIAIQLSKFERIYIYIYILASKLTVIQT